MQAVGDRIVIHEIKEKVKTDSGIFYSAADTKKIRYGKGKVITVGDLVNRVKDGDTIYYDVHRAFETVIDQQHVLVIRESDVVVRCD
jgi:co-chaperonin GroES (HSP10)